MAFSGFFFVCWRIFEMVMTIPIVGMLAWFVHQYVRQNILTPDPILVLFIVSVLALAWELFTVLSYLRARHDALFIAFIDLAFVGSFIAGVVLLRGVTHTNCGNLTVDITTQSSFIHFSINKTCTMLKASFALGIINILSFIVTFFLALLVHHHHRNDDRVVVKREYHSSRHSGHRRSASRGDNRSSRDYGDRPRSSGGRGSHHSSRRQYYV